MVTWGQNIKVILWDFDGTFYKLNDALWDEIRESAYHVVMDHTGWDHEKAKLEFLKLYKVVTPSATDTISRLVGIPIIQAALETEPYYDRAKYMSHDQKLIDMFTRLSGFRHIMMVNGKRDRLEKAVVALGLPLSIFETFITPIETGVVKPNAAHFEYALRYTKCTPQEHLMVGDREPVDLAPAKEIGMKTCLVWSEKEGEVADVTLPTIYEVPTLLV